MIDLSDTRRIYFDKFWASLETNKPVQSLVNEKVVDLRVQYKHRNNLPDEVRPKMKQHAASAATQSINNVSSILNEGPRRPDLSDFDTLLSQRRRFQ